MISFAIKIIFPFGTYNELTCIHTKTIKIVELLVIIVNNDYKKGKFWEYFPKILTTSV